MKYIASIDTQPPRSADFSGAQAAIAWAKENAGRAAWVVAEFHDDAPPRIVASGLPRKDEDA